MCVMNKVMGQRHHLFTSVTIIVYIPKFLHGFTNIILPLHATKPNNLQLCLKNRWYEKHVKLSSYLSIAHFNLACFLYVMCG